MPKQITEELLRKRAEHNDGILADLREVTLHQFEIEKIDNLHVYCRHLQILYLQNNLIPKLGAFPFPLGGAEVSERCVLTLGCIQRT